MNEIRSWILIAELVKCFASLGFGARTHINFCVMGDEMQDSVISSFTLSIRYRAWSNLRKI